MRHLLVCLLVATTALASADASRTQKRGVGGSGGAKPAAVAAEVSAKVARPPFATGGNAHGGPELVVKSPARLAIEAKGLAPNRVDRLAEKMKVWGTAKPTRKVVIKLADQLAYLFGVETMDTASFELTGSLSVSVPGLKWLGNVSGWLRHWVPSKEYRRLKTARGWREKRTGIGGGVGTALGDFGWDSVEGLMVPFVSERSFDLALGVPNVLQVALGDMRASSPTQYARGPYMGVSVELFPLNSILSVAGDLYIHYRPLEKIVERVRPLAEKVQNFLQRIRRWTAGMFRARPPGAASQEAA